ncbi:HDOD domain-containing protein [Thermosulfurimonas marina]|uniref:HDOD domain-containing protein n=1 Tax=Thermosulfurimonas marina TaxID=2047767 RepID=A0A6H1WQ50_9BACT|nr:HDOD domain-containing protein [Thermosulfurimonas marina]QJA05303.1 HDOD domain-containing protein [Thermosulfurimonas marina]
MVTAILVILAMLLLLIYFLRRSPSSPPAVPTPKGETLYTGEKPTDLSWVQTPEADSEKLRVEVYDLVQYDFDPRPQISEAVLEEVKKFLEKVPPPKILAGQIQQLLEDPRTSFSKVAKFISMDPVLTGEILKIANSAYYRTAASRKITSVNRALVLIGYNYLRMILLHYFLGRAISEHSPLSPEEIKDLWKHSLQVSAIMGYIALKKGYDSGLYLTAGILHDVGKFFLPLFGGQGAVAGLDEGSPLQEEEILYGFTHTSLGAYITRYWELPEEMQAAAAYHHPRLRSDFWDLPPERRLLVGWLTVADYLSHLYGGLKTSYAYKVPSWILEKLHLSSPEDLLGPELLWHLRRASAVVEES